MYVTCEELGKTLEISVRFSRREIGHQTKVMICFRMLLHMTERTFPQNILKT